MNNDLKNTNVISRTSDRSKFARNLGCMNEDQTFVTEKSVGYDHRIPGIGDGKVGIDGESEVAGSEIGRQWPNVSERVIQGRR